MLKKAITYTDFDGITRTEDFYFNLTATEITELEVSQDGGLSKKLEDMVKSVNAQEIIATLKNIVLLSVGEKSSDGRRFMKSDEIRKAFECSAAFDALFMELTANETASANFIKGIIPAELANKLEE